MSKKHVEDYYLKMVSDYTEMKQVLDELEKSIQDGTNIPPLRTIDMIREKVKLLESNYKRLSYIMFLLNQPNKNSKVDRYVKREHKKLDSIPIKDRRESVEMENTEVIDFIKNIR